MKQEVGLIQNNLAFSIVHIETGKLLFSIGKPYPHDWMVRDCLGVHATEEEVVRVVAYQKPGQAKVWELRHDLDGHMRKIGSWTEEEWMRAHRVAARSLIRNGANPNDLVFLEQHELDTTLGELAK